MIRHEEALRVHGLCRILRKMDILQDVLVLTHRRSLDMYSQLDREDDFDETAEAPEVQREWGGVAVHAHRPRSPSAPSVAALTQHNPEVTPPDFSTVQVTDIFQKLVRTAPPPPRPPATHTHSMAADVGLTAGCLLLQGPLSVFCARARWGPVHVVGLRRREGGLGLTLRGDSPVLVAGVVPGGSAAVRRPRTI